MSKKYVGNIGTNKILNVIFNGLKGKEDNMNEINENEIKVLWDKSDSTKVPLQITVLEDGLPKDYTYTTLNKNNSIIGTGITDENGKVIWNNGNTLKNEITADSDYVLDYEDKHVSFNNPQNSTYINVTIEDGNVTNVDTDGENKQLLTIGINLQLDYEFHSNGGDIGYSNGTNKIYVSNNIEDVKLDNEDNLLVEIFNIDHYNTDVPIGMYIDGSVKNIYLNENDTLYFRFSNKKMLDRNDPAAGIVMLDMDISKGLGEQEFTVIQNAVSEEDDYIICVNNIRSLDRVVIGLYYKLMR